MPVHLRPAAQQDAQVQPVGDLDQQRLAGSQTALCLGKAPLAPVQQAQVAQELAFGALAAEPACRGHGGFVLALRLIQCAHRFADDAQIAHHHRSELCVAHLARHGQGRVQG